MSERVFTPEERAHRRASEKARVAKMSPEEKLVRVVRTRDWKKVHPTKSAEQAQRHNLKRNYGITIEQYNVLIVSQNGVCAICRKSETMVHHKTGMTKRLAVDHDHQTGKVRGLLCSNCNRAMGLLKDDPLRVRAMGDYLEKAR